MSLLILSLFQFALTNSIKAEGNKSLLSVALDKQDCRRALASLPSEGRVFCAEGLGISKAASSLC